MVGIRNSVLNIFGGEFSNNNSLSIVATRATTAQLLTTASNNGGDGIVMDRLSYVSAGGSEALGNGGLSVNCADASVIADFINSAVIDDTNFPQ